MACQGNCDIASGSPHPRSLIYLLATMASRNTGSIVSTLYFIISFAASIYSYQFNYDKPAFERVLRAVLAYLFAIPYLVILVLVWSEEFDRKKANKAAWLAQQSSQKTPLATSKSASA
jgi:hypothetical protein